ncbi:RYamide receptor-like [Anopheles darlingi]|uniref:RYamide receptor-like n=1 Tax=Anopheles darlingi TaxID=43151 RepID=UPI002100068D|nr:RYamide receptor-like [Anopheles darlingi]
MPEGLARPHFQVLVVGAYASTLLLSIVGNTSVIAIVASGRMGMRTVTNLYLANLALGDLLMTLFCIPFSFASLFVLQYWPFGPLLCHLVNYLQAVSVLVSAYTLVAVSVDRYRAIMAPLRGWSRRRGATAKRRAGLLLGAVWTGAAVTAAPIALHSTLVQPSDWHAHCHQSICTEVWPDARADRAYSLALLLLQFLVPLVALVYTYGRIGWRLWWDHQRRTGASASPLGESRRARDRHMRRARRRTVRMMLAVVTVFIVCWLPFNVFLLVPLGEDAEHWAPLPYLWFAFHWLAMSHSCYNPLIYCYMNPCFRRAFYALLVQPCGCTRWRHPPPYPHRYGHRSRSVVLRSPAPTPPPSSVVGLTVSEL